LNNDKQELRPPLQAGVAPECHAQSPQRAHCPPEPPFADRSTMPPEVVKATKEAMNFSGSMPE
jgi:hypothetical protein